MHSQLNQVRQFNIGVNRKIYFPITYLPLISSDTPHIFLSVSLYQFALKFLIQIDTMPNLFFTPILNPPLACTTTLVAGKPIRFYACMEITTDNSVVINPDERFALMMWYTVNGRGASRSALFREITASDEDIVRLVSQSVYPPP
jgi:hypothetical protein